MLLMPDGPERFVLIVLRAECLARASLRASLGEADVVPGLNETDARSPRLRQDTANKTQSAQLLEPPRQVGSQAALGGTPATVFGDRDRRAMRAGEDGGTSARSLLRLTDRPVISPWIFGR